MNTPHQKSLASNLRERLASARQQHKTGAGSVLDVMLRSANGDTDHLVQTLMTQAGVDVVLSPEGLTPEFSRWSRSLARESRCLVLRRDDGTLLAGAEDPWNDALLQKLSRHIGAVVTPAALTRVLLDEWLGETTKQTVTALVGGQIDAIGQADGPIVGFVDVAIRSGMETGASDIHFECDRAGVTVKHRLDGVMAKFARLDGAVAAQEVISRIKVLAQLDITERRLPQDGRFRFGLEGAAIDLRVSIMPSVFGEDAVLRLLDKAQLRRNDEPASLELLGFDEFNTQRIRDLASEPSGMMLVTGPTGSGKTTTVYAILTEINTGLEKIITIEDPVEYELPGVLQIPVNERKGLTFAKGLRSILRHDPDRILVGEIRDAETAEIAVQSALTGHLVFTTVHANSLTDIMGRFRHFGLDMFGFMSSLNGVVVQRLVRQLCAHCVTHRPATAREQEWLARKGQPQARTVPVAVGCEHCHGAGYRGRFVVAEAHAVDNGLRDLVTERAPLSELEAYADTQGVVSLSVLAAQHVVAAKTSLEEVKRVVGWL
jgi:general secretion pathway protein E